MNKKAIAYLGKVDELIRDIAELEEKKKQGEQGSIEKKIEIARTTLNELLDQPIDY